MIPKQNILFKIKNASQNILTNFFKKEFCNFQCAFDGNLNVSHVLMKQIFMATEQASPTPFPPQCCAGGGVVVAFFSPKR
jgi:hypothetical protein